MSIRPDVASRYDPSDTFFVRGCTKSVQHVNNAAAEPFYREFTRFEVMSEEMSKLVSERKPLFIRFVVAFEEHNARTSKADHAPV
jgi:hypothetical protein